MQRRIKRKNLVKAIEKELEQPLLLGILDNLEVYSSRQHECLLELLRHIQPICRRGENLAQKYPLVFEKLSENIENLKVHLRYAEGLLLSMREDT